MLLLSLLDTISKIVSRNILLLTATSKQNGLSIISDKTAIQLLISFKIT